MQHVVFVRRMAVLGDPSFSRDLFNRVENCHMPAILRVPSNEKQQLLFFRVYVHFLFGGGAIINGNSLKWQNPILL